MNLAKSFFRLSRFLIVLFLSGVVMTSCGNDEPDGSNPSESTGRTVLVYMLSSNNGLGDGAPTDYDMQDIDEMCEAASKGHLGNGRLIVFHSASNGKQVLKEINSRGTVDTLKIYDNMYLPQSAARMSEVIDYVKNVASADDYGLILWGHGSGWIEDGLSEPDMDVQQTYSYGSENYDRYKMNITTLAKVLDGQGFSFIYFDCCYMASVEVMYQLRNVTETIVAYPTEVLAFGMPYDKNIRHFFSYKPDLVAAAQGTYDYYNAFTESRYRMCTVSVINTMGLERLAAATRTIYEHNTIGVPVGYTPQTYTTKSGSYYCYCDFGGYVKALNPPQNLLAEFESAMSDVVMFELATDEIWGALQINEHSGLSTFIIRNNSEVVNLKYDRLDWFRDVAFELTED